MSIIIGGSLYFTLGKSGINYKVAQNVIVILDLIKK